MAVSQRGTEEEKVRRKAGRGGDRIIAGTFLLSGGGLLLFCNKNQKEAASVTERPGRNPEPISHGKRNVRSLYL